MLPASGSHLDAAAEIRARFEAVLRASPAPKVLPPSQAFFLSLCRSSQLISNAQ